MEEQKENVVYRLYALNLTQENIGLALEQRFSRISSGYILIYTAGDAPEKSVEINGKELRRLTKADEDWIVECATRLLCGRLEKEEPKTMERLSQMVDQLSEALDAEREKLKQREKEEKTDGDTDGGVAEGAV